MDRKVLKYIKDNNLIEQGDKVLVALSGGPDSMCLLSLLYNLREELDIEIGAAHLNHLLRGSDAYSDEEYVQNKCRELNIPCFIKRVDINKMSEEEKLSSELAGRKARYDFFEQLCENKGYTKVATAHNANDQAETILFRMMRGTGIEGLCGIKVKRGNIVRPVLCLTRDEIENYCSENNIEPRIDKTNFEKIYNRNKIRLDILPYIKENFNPDIVHTLNRMSSLLKKDNLYLEEEAEKIYNRYCTFKNEEMKINRDLFNENEVLWSRVIKKALSKVSESEYDFEMKHIYELKILAEKESGKSVDLPNGLCAENVYESMYIKKKMLKDNISSEKEILISKENIRNGKEYDFGNYRFKMYVEENKNLNLKQAGSNIKYFDFDKINDSICIRTRKNGDKIIPLGMKGTKKIKNIFIDMKIPKEERENIPLVLFDDKTAWIVPYKISEEFKILKSTKNILKIEIRKKDEK